MVLDTANTLQFAVKWIYPASPQIGKNIHPGGQWKQDGESTGGVRIVDWGPGDFLRQLFCWGRWELLDERSSILVQIFDRCLFNVYSCQWPPEVICWFNSCIYIRLSKMLRWCWRFVSFNHISDWKFVITKWEARWPQQKMCCFTCFARSCLCFPVVCWGYEWNMFDSIWDGQILLKSNESDPYLFVPVRFHQRK